MLPHLDLHACRTANTEPAAAAAAAAANAAIAAGPQRDGTMRFRKPDLAQKVLVNVERFVRANESLLPCLQMPDSMALSAATERALAQLTSKKLLQKPQASLQGRHHGDREVQSIQVQLLTQLLSFYNIHMPIS